LPQSWHYCGKATSLKATKPDGLQAAARGKAVGKEAEPGIIALKEQ